MNSNDDNIQAPSRKDREREKHRIDILDAAERVFVRDGMATKIETIAKEAEYAVGSIYNFFSGKDDLFRNVLLRISQLRIDDLDALLPDVLDAPWAGIGKVVRFWLAHHVRHGDFLHVAMSQRSARSASIFPPNDPVEIALTKNGEAYRERMLRFFTALAQAREARPLDPGVMSVAFEGYVRTALFRAFRQGRGKIDVAALEAEVTADLQQLFSR